MFGRILDKGIIMLHNDNESSYRARLAHLFLTEKKKINRTSTIYHLHLFWQCVAKNEINVKIINRTIRI